MPRLGARDRIVARTRAPAPTRSAISVRLEASRMSSVFALKASPTRQALARSAVREPAFDLAGQHVLLRLVHFLDRRDDARLAPRLRRGALQPSRPWKHEPPKPAPA